MWLQFQKGKFQTHLTTNILSILCEIAIMWMPQDLTDHESALV